MAKITIDGTEYEVEAGKNLLEACLGLGLDLPYFCWHPSMGSVGSCRQCALRVYQDDNDERGRILMGCMTAVVEGMRLSLTEKSVSDFRDKCIEVTMANHPHDCPVCEEGGECHLQDVTIMSEHTQRRYRGEKKTYENQNLGPCIGHEMNRCITCYRCIRFYKDYAGGKDLAAMASRENTYFGRHEDGCLESVFSGNLVEVCPTGVFTDKTLARSYNRKWDLQTAPSICQGCSLGCNIAPAERHGKIKRITNRYHSEINGYFICDRGRFAYDHVNSDVRLRECSVSINGGGRPAAYTAALEAACVGILGAGFNKTVAVGSEKASMEENFLLKELVGSENFCSGMSASRQAILLEILKIYRSPRVDIASLKSMESCDAVIVLGENLLQSAPRMAMSVRQATRNLSFSMAEENRIPLWQDESVRILAQDARSPLIIASVAGTELDEIASDILLDTPEGIANFGFAVAHEIDSSYASANVTEEASSLAKAVAKKLSAAKNPLIISGTSLNSLEIIKAAAQISSALSSLKSGGNTLQSSKTSFVLPAANSLGLAMLLDEKSLSVDQVLGGEKYSSAVILQNDLYHHAATKTVDLFMERLDSLLVLSQLRNKTTEKAHVLIPASSFMETEGSVVNNEGRAQRYFEVFPCANEALKDNWKTLINLARAMDNELSEKASGENLKRLSKVESFDDIVALMEEEGGLLAHWSDVAPGAGFRIAGMKMPRQPHRYSGRTSMQANIKVAEGKAPEDVDSALGFTMEGAPIDRPPALNAITWSPGWNSNEAVNKFQDEIGGSLRGGDPGLCLLNIKNQEVELNYAPADQSAEGLLAVSQSRIFDSCELGVLSAALIQRADMRVAMMSPASARDFSLSDGDRITIAVGDDAVSLPLVIDGQMPSGVITIPDDVQTRRNLCAALLPGICVVSRSVNG